MADQDQAQTVSVDPPASAWFWLKDSKGQASATLTFAAVSFFVTTVVYGLSAIQSIGQFSFRSFDAAGCGAYLGTTFALYFGRRFTDAKFGG